MPEKTLLVIDKNIRHYIEKNLKLYSVKFIRIVVVGLLSSVGQYETIEKIFLNNLKALSTQQFVLVDENSIKKGKSRLDLTVLKTVQLVCFPKSKQNCRQRLKSSFCTASKLSGPNCKDTCIEQPVVFILKEIPTESIA